MIRRDVLFEYSRGSLWVLPTGFAVVAVALGWVLSQINIGPDSVLAFQGTADDARSLLIDISGTMVTVIALLLGLAVVALQLSSTQYSPRLLRNFLRDRPVQVVLGLFVGTFAYSAAGLFTVGVSAGQRSDEFPRFAVTVAIALLFVSLVGLVVFADHLAHSLQVDRIMLQVERNTLPLVRALPPGAGPAAPPPAWAVAISARVSGYVQVVRVEPLLAEAAASGVSVHVGPRPGEHVVAGGVLGWAWTDAPEQQRVDVARLGEVLHRAVRVGFERTLEQDPEFGLRQLIDAACKALSPAVNDPYTAIQAIDHLAVLYAELAARPLGDRVVSSPDGSVTVSVPGCSFRALLTLGVGLIRRYGASEPTVMAALLRLLSVCLAASVSDVLRWAAIEAESALLVADAERETAQPADLQIVHGAAQLLDSELLERRATPLSDAARGGTPHGVAGQRPAAPPRRPER
ncbi:MAG: hypothetical protein QOI16_2871 [Pseudonocardiales bacterium]|jgi:uncharacterized membrane protein|nr:hypothetical protein [Pseudonocardiales bacterium]